MCKRRRSAQPAVVYSGVNAEQVLKDIEIEVRRIIIDCQRKVFTLFPAYDGGQQNVRNRARGVPPWCRIALYPTLLPSP